MSTRPTSATLFAYQVGFGDCFLLRFSYPQGVRKHILIDFGTMELPKKRAANHMLMVANDIASKCGGRLEAVVATHRHADHISGFSTQGANSPGNVIRSLKPAVVVQPWTEKLSLAEDSLGPVSSKGFAQRAAARKIMTLQDTAARIVSALDKHERALSKPIAARVRFIGEDNIKNVSAVKNLAAMGKKNIYAYHGGPSGLEKLLPGVKTHVLGPPTLRQTETIRDQREIDRTEYWHLQFKQLADGETQIGFGPPLFPPAVVAKGTKLPASARWLANRIRLAREEELLGIVTALDDVLNNTSLILLFETGSKKLLFPGDAQIENWSLALSKDKYRKLLSEVDLYKVGHHGSLNATPKSMWNAFKKKGQKDKRDRLTTVLSTLPGKHGSEKNKSEVPRETLVTQLRQHSDFHSTHTLKEGVLLTQVEISL